MLGIPTGDVLIIAQRKDSTLAHNILRGSAKPPTSTGEVHFIRYRDTWRRRITSTLTQLSAHFGALAATAMAARLLPLQLTLSLYSHVHFTLSTLSICSQQDMPFYRQIWSTWRGQ